MADPIQADRRRDGAAGVRRDHGVAVRRGRGQEPGVGRQGPGDSGQASGRSGRARRPACPSAGNGTEEHRHRRRGQGQGREGAGTRRRSQGPRCRTGRAQPEADRQAGGAKRRWTPKGAKNMPPTWPASAWRPPRSTKTPSTRRGACWQPAGQPAVTKICATGNGAISSGCAGKGSIFQRGVRSAALRFAPDGKWFVTAGEDGQAHLWDPVTGKLIRDIDHGSPIMAVAVSPDGKLVATAGADGQVRISSASDGKLLHTLAGHEDRVLGVAFSPDDGRWLATASRDRTVRIWDVTTGARAALSPARPLVVGLVGGIFARRQTTGHRRTGRQGHGVVVRSGRR